MTIISLIDKKICAACDSTETYTYEGCENWRWHDGYRMCKDCYDFYVWKPYYNTITVQRNHPRRITFLDERIYLLENKRIGKCELCRKSIGDWFTDFYGKLKRVTKTEMHHIDYHKNNPIEDTIELCSSCHMKESWLQRRLLKLQKRKGG